MCKRRPCSQPSANAPPHKNLRDIAFIHLLFLCLRLAAAAGACRRAHRLDADLRASVRLAVAHNHNVLCPGLLHARRGRLSLAALTVEHPLYRYIFYRFYLAPLLLCTREPPVLQDEHTGDQDCSSVDYSSVDCSCVDYSRQDYPRIAVWTIAVWTNDNT